MTDQTTKPVYEKRNLNYQELVDAFTQKKELQIQMLKQRCSEDLFLFNKYILGVQTGQGKMPLADFHRDLCYFVQNQRDRKKLILVPRGHLKSTLVTIGYSLFRIIENPNVRILILNATWQMAVDFLTEIKNHLEKNELLMEVYGTLAAGNTEWAQDRITLARSNQGLKGPTVWAAGVDTNLVGAHPDMIILDDVVNREIADSDENMHKVIMRYKDVLDLLEPGGQLIVIGTRWNDRDLYEWILNPDNNVIAGFDVMVKPAFESDFGLTEIFQSGDGAGLVRNHLWPEKFSFKELRDRFKGKGPYEFSSQYLNNPVPSEEADFKASWFHYGHLADWHGRITNRYMTIDPAISLRKEADYTAVMITDVDGYGTLFPVHIENLKIDPTQLINLIFRLAENYHPRQIGIELVAFQKVLQYALNEEMKRRQRFLPITELQIQDRSKDERIRALQPLYANGKILHSKEVKNITILEEQLLRFPRGKHDDVIDAFSATLDLIVPPKLKNVDEDQRFHKHYLY